MTAGILCPVLAVRAKMSVPAFILYAMVLVRNLEAKAMMSFCASGARTPLNASSTLWAHVLFADVFHKRFDCKIKDNSFKLRFCMLKKIIQNVGFACYK
jgi:hypothetical protein